jgi:hypothetical protein
LRVRSAWARLLACAPLTALTAKSTGPATRADQKQTVARVMIADMPEVYCTGCANFVTSILLIIRPTPLATRLAI